MTGEEERTLRAYLSHTMEIDNIADDVGFEAWEERRYESPEADDFYKYTLELAEIWEKHAKELVQRYNAGYQAGYESGLLKAIEDLERQSSLATGAPVAHHLEDCAGPGCGASCTCWCHAGEGRG